VLAGHAQDPLRCLRGMCRAQLCTAGAGRPGRPSGGRQHAWAECGPAARAEQPKPRTDHPQAGSKDSFVELPVVRRNGADGKVTVEFMTRDGTGPAALAGECVRGLVCVCVCMCVCAG